MTPTAAQLRAARGFLGWSRGQAAHKAGLHQSTLARVERGAPTVEAATVERIAAAYAVAGVQCEGRDGVRRVVPC